MYVFFYEGDTQSEKINEIKEFLTLTSQNTLSFFDISQSNLKECSQEQSSNQKSIQDFEVVRGLGKGAFGQVFLVKEKSKSSKLFYLDKCYAMKIISKDKVKSEQ